MKALFFAAFFLLVHQANANEINCLLEETLNNEVSAQTVTLPESSDPHGALSNFTLSKFKNYEGFVALSNGFTVINLVNSETGVATSVQSKSATENYVRLQMLINLSEGSLDMIVIQCGEPTK